MSREVTMGTADIESRRVRTAARVLRRVATMPLVLACCLALLLLLVLTRSAASVVRAAAHGLCGMIAAPAPVAAIPVPIERRRPYRSI
jgi:hypothetical protein